MSNPPPAPPSPDAGDGDSLQQINSTSRSRWATRRMTTKSGGSKRTALMDRMQQSNNEKEDQQDPPERKNSKTDAAQAEAGGKGKGEDEDEDENGGRTLYFNQPLPPEMQDTDGRPLYTYPRNKIRTAKYTPLSFVPKNLWFQFHNIANIYFLFVVILGCFSIFGVQNPALNAVPIIFIVTVTAIKDAIEDYRRTILDIELNNAQVHRLRHWTNVNVAEDQVSLWRRTKKGTSRFFASLWRGIKSLWSKKAREQRKKIKEEKNADLEEPRPSVETARTKRNVRDSLAATPFSHRESFISAAEDIQMTPVPSPGPTQHARLAVPTSDDARRAQAVRDMKGDVINYKRSAHGARFQKDAWKNLTVGDFVRIYNDDELPADIIILSTSDPDGACYVETKNLDGETNLKVRQALRCGQSMKHARDCERAEFTIESEPPQPNLYKYNGAAKWVQEVPGFLDEDLEQMVEPISIDNLLLRGCNLRNTEWVLGIVVFTGHDTKIMMNAGVTPTKRARIARELNFHVICNFVILFLMCLLAAIINGVAWAKTNASLHYFDFGSEAGTPPLTGFVNFWAAVILFQNLVPISLYITMEVVRTLQAIFIYNDIEMYYEPIDQPCVPKSWNISDDMGQIEYIFSDKTGTLTQNVMEFKKATVNGQPYGEAYTEAQAGMQKRQGIDIEVEGAKIRAEIAEAKIEALARLRRMNDNPYLHDDDLHFIAPDFVADLNGESGHEQQQSNVNFMLALALCHTVIPERTLSDPPKMIFKAQSPDEEALVSTARDMGFTVLSYSQDGINLNVLGEDRHYQILNTIEFNSTRKRMSSIVRMPDGKIILFCKGADSIIYSRLKKGEQQTMRKETADHLELFAREGLRTLCIAQKELTEEQYYSWKKQHDVAAAALEEREEKLEAVAELIEQDLYLIGGTAIEDRLQDAVPETIELLGDAGIKLWVLTGDKVETAINIGFSCNLLNNSMDLLHIKLDEKEDGSIDEEALVAEADKILTEKLRLFNMTGDDAELAAAKENHEPPAPTHGLVIDGFTLRWVLNEDLKQKFLLLCKQCKSVLCCRVSPAQKAAVVSMVKNGLDVMTLSIGDGANDVAMIQEADVGVGIAGLEGRQAAMSSDYAIGQFRFLQRLVLVHGRWSYRRMAESTANFFYKNMVWSFVLFWYMIYCEFDSTNLFDYSYIILFNLVFTSIPVGLLGVFDQDVSDKVSLAVPQLYRRGIERLEWTLSKFWFYMLDGTYQSVIGFFVPYLMFRLATTVTTNGLDASDRLHFGTYIAHPAVLTINLYILMNTYQWDWIMLLVIFISDIFIFFWTGVYTSFDSAVMFYGVAKHVYAQPTFWASFCLVPIMCILPRFAIKSIQKLFFPLDVDIIREQDRMGAFDHLKNPKDVTYIGVTDNKLSGSESSKVSKPPKHQAYGSIDEDRRPIYPPSTTTRATGPQHSQNGSDSTGYTVNRYSVEVLPATMTVRPSMDRARPSYDRIRASMDRVRPSFEASDDFTSSARLSRIESSRTYTGRLGPRLRGLSLSKSANQ
ncbi:unnamed protein product [Clonostachys byssicola]|uniref:Phospholipid-transporting ATPase n=1 Tax=Clonostachys byssicola TaxID=160290 RepID=A0A9N9USX0_9HYPO|nr:unnamed protein product [Clonostachys byssicola]